MPCKATQDGRVMVESSDKTWSTGEGNGKPLQYSCLEKPMNSMKRQKDRTLTPHRYVLSMLQEISGETTPERMKRQNQSKNNTQLWMWLVIESKVRCCKKQYCKGTWNVRSMNQGKLEVVKQEMARVIINVLEISELKWTGIGEFNSDDHHIYYCGQKSLRRNGVAIIANKSLKCSTWMQSQKQQNDFCLIPRQAIHYHGNPSLCPNQ